MKAPLSPERVRILAKFFERKPVLRLPKVRRLGRRRADMVYLRPKVIGLPPWLSKKLSKLSD